MRQFLIGVKNYANAISVEFLHFDFVKGKINRIFCTYLCYTVLATQMCTLLYLPPFFLPMFLSSNNRKQKSVVDKDKTEKNKKKLSCGPFLIFLGNHNGHPSNDPRAYVLAEVSAVIRKRREWETKREIDTQRMPLVAQKGTQIMGWACPCLSLHLVSPWRNFTWRKLRKSRVSIISFLGRAFEAVLGGGGRPHQVLR